MQHELDNERIESSSRISYAYFRAYSTYVHKGYIKHALRKEISIYHKDTTINMDKVEVITLITPLTERTLIVWFKGYKTMQFQG